jgi:hypothetical protein
MNILLNQRYHRRVAEVGFSFITSEIRDRPALPSVTLTRQTDVTHDFICEELTPVDLKLKFVVAAFCYR